LTDVFAKHLENIDRYTYRVEKALKELANDLKKQRTEINNPQASAVSEAETINRVKNFSNVILNSVLKVAITNSLESLATKLEEFYAMLPLPFIAPQFEVHFPPHLLGKKHHYRLKYFLEHETVTFAISLLKAYKMFIAAVD